MQATAPSQSQQFAQQAWFDEFVATLRSHQLMLHTNTATAQLEHVYRALIQGSEMDLATMSRQSSSRWFIKAILIDYLAELSKRTTATAALWIRLLDAKILVWAQIKDDDETTEDALLLAEAAVNAKYAAHGFAVSSMIVELGDRINPPNHYQPLPIG